jgi:filamentous hemagglutinin family protein
MNGKPPRRTKSLFRCSCAATVLVAALASQPVRAQQAPGMIVENIPHIPGNMIVANQPQVTGVTQPRSIPVSTTPTFALGSGSYTPGATFDTVNITSNQAIIDWNLNGTVDAGSTPFVDTGERLVFTGNSDQTVLNRLNHISGTNPIIEINGDITGSAALWFYTPGGFLIGQDATFNVGSLILTTLPIDTSGDTTLFGPGGEIRFGQAPNPNSSIVIEDTPGGAIQAMENGSYLALVAPRIEQGGSIEVNGSVAYIAAEQAELTINNGLFDINVIVGTTDSQGIVHTGETTGPSSSPTPAQDAQPGEDPIPANPDAQAIYLVAVPKNDAITMLIRGEIGYEAAASADIQNGMIVLSSGYNVSVGGTDEDPVPVIDTAPINGFAAAINLGNAGFSSDALVQSSGTLSVGGDDSIFQSNSDLGLTSATQIDFGGSNGGGVDIDGNVTLRAGANGQGGIINVSIDTGEVDSEAFGQILIGGNFTADASGYGLQSATPPANGQNAQGGIITVNIVDGGILDVGGTASFLADAYGGEGTQIAGNAQGGTVTLNLNGDNAIGDLSIIDVGGLVLSASASTYLDGLAPSPALEGSDSTAGTVNFNITGGSLNAGFVGLSADAFATLGTNGSPISNDATAGTINASFTDGAHNIGDIFMTARALNGGALDASGFGSDGLSNGGTITLLVDGALTDVNVDGGLFIDASTDGVTTAATSPDVVVDIANGATLSVNNNFRIDVNAIDGNNVVVNTAGNVTITVDGTGSLLSSDDLSVYAYSRTSYGGTGTGGDKQGGNVAIYAQNGGGIYSGFIGISVDAAAANAAGGIAQGGTILISVDTGSVIDFSGGLGGFAFLSADGRGNSIPGANGGPTGFGGSIEFRIDGGAMEFGRLFAGADGRINYDGEGGGTVPEGIGGSAVGGTFTLNLLGGTFTADDVDISTDGFGGQGGASDDVTQNREIVSLSGTDRSMPGLVTTFGLAASALPPDPAADGGVGAGGTVTINLNGGNATVTNLTVSANGFGGDGATGNVGVSGSGSGGAGLGGDATFNAITGTLTVTNQLTVAANGTGGDGGFGDGVDGGHAGDGTGGTATFNFDGTSTIDAGTVLVQADGSGGNAGDSDRGVGGEPAGRGGDGGTGTGGTAIFSNTAGDISFGTLTVQALGTGSNGGDSRQFTVGIADDFGGNGGDGIGGIATINLNQDDLSNPAYVVSANAVGGNGGQGIAGGNGGNATAGTATINVNNVAAVLNSSTITAVATGGNGGTPNAQIGNGGSGGNATGGTARFEVTGSSGSADISGGGFSVDTSGYGGSGSDGYSSFGYAGGDGGDGGGGTGGNSEIIARTGGAITITTGSPFTFSSTGAGGNGGAGGYAYNSDGGDGGDGGLGTGGTARFLAQGGTITANDVNILVTGSAGAAGMGGIYGAYGTIGADGTEGTAAGGTGIIEVQEGSPGIITMGAVIIQADGLDSIGAVSPYAYGGTVIIADTSTDPLGLITFDSLDISANVVPGTPGSGVFISSNSGAITVTNDATISAGDNVEFAFEDDGQFVVGGALNISTLSSALVSHTNRTPGVDSIDVTGDLTVTAGIDFDAMSGTVLSAGSSIIIIADGNASADDLSARELIVLTAGQDALLNNAVTTGPISGLLNLTGIFVDAGFSLDFSGLQQFDPNFNATITGTVSSATDIRVRAGGNAIFQSGADVGANDQLLVQTGDDIIIGSGAVLASSRNPSIAPNPADPFNDASNLRLEAGALSSLLVTTPLTPIASIDSAGVINANSSAAILTANAIDGFGGVIAGSSISADINNAPPNGIAQSDDSGLLSAPCVEGNACLGSLFADNRLEIGQNGVPIALILDGGAVAAVDVLVTTRSGMIIGIDGVASSFSASNQLLIESQEGDIDLRDAAINSGTLQIIAAGSLLGTGSLTSANDVGITVSGDLFAASIVAGGQLTEAADIGGALEGQYVVTGSIGVDFLSVGAGNVDIVAGQDIILGDVNAPGTDIVLSANNYAYLGGTSGAANIAIDATLIEIGDISAGNAIDLIANSNVFGGAASAGGDITIDGPAGVDLFALDAGNTIDVQASGGAARIDTANSGGDTTITGQQVALNNGAIGGNLTLTATAGDIDGNGAITVGGTIDLDASGAIGFGSLDAQGGDFTVDAGDDIAFTSATASNDIVFDGASISGGTMDAGSMVDARGTGGIVLDVLAAGGNAELRSDTGAVVVTTDITVAGQVLASGGAISLNSLGDLTVSDARATNGDVDIVAVGDLFVGFSQSIGDINLASTGGSVTVGSLEAGVASVMPANAQPQPGNLVPLGTVVGSPGPGDITITAATDAVILDDIFAPNLLLIDAGGLIDVQALAYALSITTSSADFNIEDRGQLGTSDYTQDIFIQSNGTNQMVLGGPPATGVFSLDNDEFALIFSGGDLTLFAVDTGAAAPSMIVRGLTAFVADGSGGPQDGNIGMTGTLLLASEGQLRVNDELALARATSTNVLALLSDTGIRVDASTANVSVLNANGGLAGMLTLTAPSVIVATDAAVADITGATTSAIDLRLASSDGIDRDDGFIQARGMIINAATGAFIQNSVAGTDYADRRGFVVGDGGLAINATGTGALAIVIDGVQRGSTSGTITGIDLIPVANITGAFDSASTINGCLIVSPITCSVVTTTTDPRFGVPVQDLIEEDVEEKDEDGLDGMPVSPLIETVEIFPNREGPIIDDPVTGAGNDDLWLQISAGGDQD